MCEAVGLNDEGSRGPNAFALPELTPEAEAQIVEIVERALR